MPTQSLPKTITFVPTPVAYMPPTRLNWMAWTGLALAVGAAGFVVWRLTR